MLKLTPVLIVCLKAVSTILKMTSLCIVGSTSVNSFENDLIVHVCFDKGPAFLK